MKKFDYVIIGAGIYGLYTALHLKKKGASIALFERDSRGFSRASFINQARVHNGYHYPRSMATAGKASSYFKRFSNDFKFAINSKFENIYAISSSFTDTNAESFERFCSELNVKCIETDPNRYFMKNTVESAFITEEYAFSADMIYEYLIEQINTLNGKSEIIFNSEITDIKQTGSTYSVNTSLNEKIICGGIINTSYASVNQINKLCGYELFNLKYEICEIILCKTGEILNQAGITVMDGPFFSIIPFGNSGLHSLTSVMFTPHSTSYNILPEFTCQSRTDKCSAESLYNCNICREKPDTAYNYMSKLASKYLSEHIKIKYSKSLFSIKPILRTSEIDDSRPTCIVKHSESPLFISVLSGKINTVYDIEEVI